MNVIYHCYGGTHSSVVAASIHVGLLPDDRLPEDDQLVSLPLFDKLTSADAGKTIFVGEDERGHRVYCLGRRHSFRRIKQALVGLERIYAPGSVRTLFVNTMRYVNVSMRTGGFLSRRLGNVKVGRAVVLRGTKAAFRGLSGLVKRVKANLSQEEPAGRREQAPPRTVILGSEGRVEGLLAALIAVEQMHAPPDAVRIKQLALLARSLPAGEPICMGEAQHREVYFLPCQVEDRLVLGSLRSWVDQHYAHADCRLIPVTPRFGDITLGQYLEHYTRIGGWFLSRGTDIAWTELQKIVT
ncbi:MAG: DUF3189 family protein [Bacillota bacterium]